MSQKDMQKALGKISHCVPTKKLETEEKLFNLKKQQQQTLASSMPNGKDWMPFPAGTGQGSLFSKPLFFNIGDAGGPFRWKMKELSLFTDHTLIYIENTAKATKKLLGPMDYQVLNIPRSSLLVDPGSRPSDWPGDCILSIAYAEKSQTLRFWIWGCNTVKTPIPPNSLTEALQPHSKYHQTFDFLPQNWKADSQLYLEQRSSESRDDKGQQSGRAQTTGPQDFLGDLQMLSHEHWDRMTSW